MYSMGFSDVFDVSLSTLCSDVQGGFYFQNRILRTFERGSAENENFVRNSYINIYIIYRVNS